MTNIVCMDRICNAHAIGLSTCIRELGWVPLTEKIYITEDGTAVVLHTTTFELIELVYMKGFYGGLQRGLYEAETMEDV